MNSAGSRVDKPGKPLGSDERKFKSKVSRADEGSSKAKEDEMKSLGSRADKPRKLTGPDEGKFKSKLSRAGEGSSKAKEDEMKSLGAKADKRRKLPGTDDRKFESKVSRANEGSSKGKEDKLKNLGSKPDKPRKFPGSNERKINSDVSRAAEGSSKAKEDGLKSLGTRKLCTADNVTSNALEYNALTMAQCQHEILSPAGFLWTECMDLFLLGILPKHCNSRFRTQSCFVTQQVELIQPRFGEDLFLLYHGRLVADEIGHWICVHYHKKMINIYDSLGVSLNGNDKLVLQTLYPENNGYIFHKVQRQPDVYSCGIFAIAFATAIARGVDPSTVLFLLNTNEFGEKRKTDALRQHFWQMCLTSNLTMFPTESIAPSSRSTSGMKRKLMSSEECPDMKWKRKDEKKCVQQNIECANSKEEISMRTEKLSSKEMKSNDLHVKLTASTHQEGKKSQINRKATDQETNYGKVEASINQEVLPPKTYLRKAPKKSEAEQKESRRMYMKEYRAKVRDDVNKSKKRSEPSENVNFCISKNVMSSESELYEETIDFFLLNIAKQHPNSNLNPQSVKLQSLPYLLQSRFDEDILILKRETTVDLFHWSTVHYKDEKVYVFDSCNKKFGLKEIEIIQKVYPKISCLTYVPVQPQPDIFSSGILAIAFSTSILLKENPSETSYFIDIDSNNKTRTLRKNLLNMFNKKRLIPFPKSTVEISNLSNLSGKNGKSANKNQEDANHNRSENNNKNERRNVGRKDKKSESLTTDKCDLEWKKVKEHFENSVRQIPDNICQCCGRMWYLSSVVNKTRSKLLAEDVTEDTISKIFNCEEVCTRSYFCSSCYVSIKKNEVPVLCLTNNLTFPEVEPVVQQLTRIEERLVAPRHIFQSIWCVRGPQGQYKTKGGIINIPVNVDTTIQQLPRMLNDTSTIHLRLARRIEQNNDYMSGNIRLNNVFEAAKLLVTKPLYVQHNITLHEEWVGNNLNFADNLNGPLNNSPEMQELEETLLVGDTGLRIAPAQGFHPVSILLDRDSEYLSFVQIYGGHRFHPNVDSKPMSYTNICKSVFMRYDRRAAKRHDYILFAAKKLELTKLVSNIQICLRKRKNSMHSPSEILAKNVLKQDFLNNLIQHDDAYQVFNGVRNSSYHWHKEKLKVLAMIRQFGLPTLFITNSAAETHWFELLVILKKMIDGVVITEEEAKELPSKEKNRLVQLDPMTCSKYFHRRYRELQKTWKSRSGPFGNYTLSHFYYRLEIQQRGSLHGHQLVWLEGAPIYNPDIPETADLCTKFIDEIISTSSTDNEACKPFIPLQMHNHTATCRKYDKDSCRFGIPFFPMEKTVILSPLPKEVKEKFQKVNYDNLTKIKNLLSDKEKMSSLQDFKQFLRKINLNEESYIFAVRSSLKKHKVIYKRDIKDVFLNNYSPKILELMHSNMDCQFILDAYACCTYIVDYINKADRGMSAAMKRLLQESREGNVQLKERLRSITNLYYNNSELSVQEASMNIMSIPMSEASSAVQFIPINPPNERVKFLKQEQELQELDPESLDVFETNMLEYYSWRPKYLENLCLAEFAAWYSCSRIKKRTSSKSCKKKTKTNKDIIEINENTRIKYSKRTKEKVIRFKTYSANKDSRNYYRMLLMLYHPYREEEKEILNVDCEEKCKMHSVTIRENRQKFCKFDDNFLDEIVETIETNLENDAEVEASSKKSKFDIDDFILESDENFTDVFESASRSKKFTENFPTPLKLSREEYVKLVSSLNQLQRDYVLHVANILKTQRITKKNKPFYHFVTGGAGTGKSVLISAIYQAISRIYHKDPDINPDLPIVLLTASTGKAAYNISAQTLHTAFNLPFNQKDLSDDDSGFSNTMAALFKHVKILVIDEVSMIAEHILRMIDKRLRFLFDESLPFGGISVILVGDFNQLPPVRGKPLYGSLCENPYVEVFGIPLWHLFEVYTLTTVMRQSETKFITALNNFANGDTTEEDMEFFKSRTFKEVPAEAKKQNPLHLFYTNKEVNAFNEIKLKEIDGPEIKSQADDIVVGDGPQSAKKSLLNWAQHPSTTLNDTSNMPRYITLKVGAKYMLLRNSDTKDGLVNGATGILRIIDLGKNPLTEELRPMRLWLEFEEAATGSNLRMSYKRILEQRKLPEDCTPIELSIVSFKRNEHSEYKLHIERKHFGLTVSEAISLHKSQGGSYNIIVVHVTDGMTRALIYVGLSRARTSEGLIIIGEIKLPKKTPAFLKLQEEKKRWHDLTVVPKFKFLYEPRTCKQMLFFNVQSFNAHRDELVNDSTFLCSNFIFLAETWTMKTDNFDIPNFQCLSRHDNKKVRKAYGTCCLASSEDAINFTSWNVQVTETNQELLSVSGIRSEDILMVAVYKTPKAPTAILKPLFQLIKNDNSSKKIVVGDFNIDVKMDTVATNELIDIMEGAGIFLCETERSDAGTTDAGSSLDLIGTNFDVQCGVYESLTSYHKPIWIRF